MECAKLSVEDHTRLVGIVAKLLAMAISPVPFALNAAKSAAIIRDATSYVMNLVRHVLSNVPGLARIVDGAHCHVRCRVTCYHARSAVQRHSLVGIDVRRFVGRSVPMLRIVRFVRNRI
jgi:hypothetical protein